VCQRCVNQGALLWGVPKYFRPKVNGATVFFTVVLAHRGRDLLVRYFDVMQQAVRVTQAERPFEIDAWVILPDHFHCVWTLPKGDAEYSVRMGAIKARFVMGVRRAGFTPPMTLPVVRVGRFVGVNPDLRVDKGEVGVWQRRFWEHHIRDERDYENHVRYCWGERRRGNDPGDRFSRERAKPRGEAWVC
jgi:putative transposase